MKYQEQIEELSNKLDKDLQDVLYENYNYLPTITSTFECIENSSPSFRMILKRNFNLEHSIKEEIGKTLNFHHKLDKSMKPPFANYFRHILTSLLKKNPTSTTIDSN